MTITERVTTASGTYGSSLDIAEKPEATGIKTKPRFKGILLPKRYLLVAELKAEEQYLKWRKKQGYSERDNRNIDFVRLLTESAPRHVIVPETDHVIYYSNIPGVQMEEIAETFGGEIGLVRSEIDIMNPFRNGSEKRGDIVHLNRVLDLVHIVPLDWKELDGEAAAAHFLTGSEFDVPSPLLLTKKEGKIAVVMKILGLDREKSQKDSKLPWGRVYGTGVRFGVGQATFEGYNDPPPVFGAEKKAMLDVIHNIAAAFGHKAT